MSVCTALFNICRRNTFKCYFVCTMHIALALGDTARQSDTNAYPHPYSLLVVCGSHSGCVTYSFIWYNIQTNKQTFIRTHTHTHSWSHTHTWHLTTVLSLGFKLASDQGDKKWNLNGKKRCARNQMRKKKEINWHQNNMKYAIHTHTFDYIAYKDARHRIYIYYS